MTPAAILADTLQVDPARVEAALAGHGFTVVRNRPLGRLWAAAIISVHGVDPVALYGDDEPAWLAARGAITPRPDAPTAEHVIRRHRDSYQPDPEAPT